MVYGVKGQDYTEKEGTITSVKDDQSFYRNVLFGTYSAVYKKDEDHLAGTRYDKEKSYWDTLKEEPLIGFLVDVTDIKNEVMNYSDRLGRTMPAMGSKSYGSEWDAFMQEFQVSDVKKIEDTVQKQLDAYIGTK